MLNRRTIRAVVSYLYEGVRAFEKYINQKYPPNTKNLSLHVVSRPAQRDQLFWHLTDGTTDIAIARLTINLGAPEDREMPLGFFLVGGKRP